MEEKNIPVWKNSKYKMIRTDKKGCENHVLYRIQALKDFGDVKAGDLGGYIESEKNLSPNDSAWVFDQAMVLGDSKIMGHSSIRDFAIIHNSNVVDTIIKGKSIFVNADAKHSVSLDYAYVENAVLQNCSICDRVVIAGENRKAELKDCHLSNDVSIDGEVQLKNSILEDRVSIEGNTILDNVFYSDNKKIVNQEVISLSKEEGKTPDYEK